MNDARAASSLTGDGAAPALAAQRQHAARTLVIAGVPRRMLQKYAGGRRGLVHVEARQLQDGGLESSHRNLVRMKGGGGCNVRGRTLHSTALTILSLTSRGSPCAFLMHR